MIYSSLLAKVAESVAPYAFEAVKYAASVVVNVILTFYVTKRLQKLVNRKAARFHKRPSTKNTS